VDENYESPMEPVVVEAEVIESNRMPDGSVRVHAYGHVLFQQGNKRLTGDEFFYNSAINTGLLRNASITTCNKPDPDYRITAREIRLTSDQKLMLKRARVYLGNFKVLSLPKLSVNLSGQQEARSLIPRPGYGSRDGFFLRSNVPLMGTVENDLELDLKLTVKRGIQGGFVGGHAITGSALAAPPYVPDWRIELRRTSILQPTEYDDRTPEVAFRGSKASPNLTAIFASVLSRAPVPDIDLDDGLVSSLPEVGIRVVSRQAGINEPPIGLQGQLRGSWGRFEEHPDNVGPINRWDIRGTGSTTLAKLSKDTALRASGLARYSSYDTGDHYSVLGASLDVSRIFPGGSYASLRLINHWINGSTPFEFDDVDIDREIQAAGRIVRGRNSVGVVLDYDLGENELRSWQLRLAHRMDCLEPSISFNSDLRQVSVGLRVLGL
jgi:hypothetical protein